MPNKDQSKLIALDADNFVKALKGEDVVDVSGNPQSFYHRKYHYQDSTISKSVVIKGILVNDQISIQAKDELFPYDILFEDGTFESLFRIHSGEFSRRIRFCGGVFKKGLEIWGGNFSSTLEFEGDSWFSHLYIHGGSFQEVGFLQLTIEETLKIYDGNFGSRVYLSSPSDKTTFICLGGIFESNFEIVGGEFEKVTIEQGQFRNSFVVSDGKFWDDFRIFGGDFLKDLVINKGEFDQLLAIAGCQVKGQLKILDGTFSKIFIGEEKENEKEWFQDIILSTTVHNEVVISPEKLGRMIFNGTIKSSGMLYLQHTALSQIEFKVNFRNAGKLELSDIKLIDNEYHDKAILFKDCDIGSAVFINVPFISFDRVVISKPKINAISTNYDHIPLRTRYPSKVFGFDVSDQNSEKEEVDSHFAECYNQLMLAMQKQGNRVQEIQYYGEYMNWLLKEKISTGNWSMAGMLWLNKNSTNFGSSWVRGAMLMFLVGWCFYFLYCLSLGLVTWRIDDLSANIGYHIGSYFEFLIPTHKFNFMSGAETEGIAKMIDFFGRIALGYLIYQTIAAFRIYGKR